MKELRENLRKKNLVHVCTKTTEPEIFIILLHSKEI